MKRTLLTPVQEDYHRTWVADVSAVSCVLLKPPLHTHRFNAALAVGVGLSVVFGNIINHLSKWSNALSTLNRCAPLLWSARHPSRSMSPNTAFYLEFTEPRVWDIDEMVAVLLQSVLFTRSLRRIRLIADGTVEADIQKAFVGDTSVTHQVLTRSSVGNGRKG